MKPSEEIRKIYDKRREAKEKGEIDEYDFLFGKKDTLIKSIAEYLDETYDQRMEIKKVMNDKKLMDKIMNEN